MAQVVIGLGFGDEGKGATTSYLSSLNPDAVVVRYSGGSQAGHHVLLQDGRQHIFASYGSGTLLDNVTYIAGSACVNPIDLLRERDVLIEKGIENPTLYISPDCELVTPLDEVHNRSEAEYEQYGTTGCGINTTFRRAEAGYSLTAGDIQHLDIFLAKLKSIERNYYETPYKWDSLEFKQACLMLLEVSTIADLPNDVLTCDKIYEGSQGLLLDQDIGVFPHVTPANVGLRNETLWSEDYLETFYVTRAYATRHGNGPFMCSPLKVRNPNETNTTNKWQGEFRVGRLNLDLYEYALSKEPAIADRRCLVVTCLEHILDGPLTYEYDSKTYEFTNERDFCVNIAKALGFDAVYKMANHHMQFVENIGGKPWENQA